MRFIRGIWLKKLLTIQLRLCETVHGNRKQGTNLRIVIGTTNIRQRLMFMGLDVRHCEMLGVTIIVTTKIHREIP
jgi:hypothetical protein